MGISDQALTNKVYWVSQKQGKNIIINYDKSITKIINKGKTHIYKTIFQISLSSNNWSIYFKDNSKEKNSLFTNTLVLFAIKTYEEKSE